MIQIRTEQMRLLNEHLRKIFVERARLHLREVFPEETRELTDPDLNKTIEQAMAKAADFNIQAEQPTILFIDLAIGLGPDFEKQEVHRWMQPILEKTELNEQEKMELIYQRLQA